MFGVKEITQAESGFRENKTMDFSIIKYNRGAKLADEHYTETGHKIEEFGEQRTVMLANLTYDLIKHYKCTECDFNSDAGERIKRY